jgi:predicted ATPase
VNVIDSGRAEEGIALMERALVEHRRTGANFQSSYNLSRLAEAHARAGKLERAMQLAAEAVAEVGRTGERWWEAEAQRSRAEILFLSGPQHHDAAECGFREALACARRQEARLWELNAAQGLARMWLAKGRHREARDLLEPVYRTSADGFDGAEPRGASHAGSARVMPD